MSLAAQLLSHADDAVYDNRLAERLLTHAVFRDHERFTSELARALSGPPSVAERAGRIWAIADIRHQLADELPNDVSQLSEGARRGAAEVYAKNVEDADNHLTKLLNDSSPEVRNAAASAMRHIADLDLHQSNELLKMFTASAAFDENFEHITFTLKRLGELPESAIEACERAVVVGGNDLGDLRTARARRAATSSRSS